MSVFLDTSALAKLYFPEMDSLQFRARLQRVSGVAYLSALTMVEFASATEKKVRTGEVTPAFAQIATRLFAQDLALYRFVALSDSVLQTATQLVSKYTASALRALDAIQLACALQVRSEASLFLTADARLETIFSAEGLPIR